MREQKEAVRTHYDTDPKKEWDRLKKRHPYEKYITIHMMDRYIRPGDRILDIGYCIGKNDRGKGCGTEGLRLTLEEARKIVPEKEFYLRVNRDNPASLRVMLKNGGRIAAEDPEKYYVRIPNPGP